jgi:hypothetical protein
VGAVRAPRTSVVPPFTLHVRRILAACIKPKCCTGKSSFLGAIITYLAIHYRKLSPFTLNCYIGKGGGEEKMLSCVFPYTSPHDLTNRRATAPVPTPPTA